MNNIGKSTGFTLIEVLIAIVIFAVVITTLFSTFRAFIITSETVNTDLAFSNTFQNALRRIRLDLESVFISQYPEYKKPGFNSDPDPYQFIGEESSLGQQTVSSLSFTSLAHTGLGVEDRYGVSRISYYLKDNESGLLDLYRTDTLLTNPDDTASCRDPVLCRNISAFKITFTDSTGEAFERWDSESETFDHTLPAGVHFHITLQSGEHSRKFGFSVMLNTGRPPD